MKKYLLILLVIIALVVVFLPFCMGRMMASQFKREVNNLHYPGVTVKLENYHTGWFMSNATLTVTRSFPRILKALSRNSSKTFPQTISYTAKLHIYHGPVALAYNIKHQKQLFWGQGVAVGTLALNDADALPIFKQLQGIEQPASLFAVFSMSGKATVMSAHSGMRYVNVNKGLIVNIGRAQSSLYLSKSSDQINGSMTLDSVNITSKKGQVDLSPINIDFNLKRNADVLWYGNYSFTLPKLVVSSGDQTLLTLNKLAINTHTNIDNDLFAGNMGMTIDNITAMKYQINQVKLDMDFKGYHVPALLDLIKAKKANSFSTDKDARRNQQLDMLVDVLKGASIVLNTFQANTPIGPVKLSGHVDLPDSLSLPKAGKADDRLSGLGKQVLLHGELTLPLPAKQVNPAGLAMGPGPVMPAGTKPYNSGTMMLNMIIQSAYQKGYFAKVGDRLAAVLDLKDGEATLNGKPFPEKPKPVATPLQDKTPGQVDDQTQGQDQNTDQDQAQPAASTDTVETPAS
jgi:uncharacterized protein YdgA (DUF945 family)